MKICEVCARRFENDEYKYCPICGVKLSNPNFPIITTIYLHSSKESMLDKGKKLGLSEDACEEFMYALYEVGIEIEVYENGGYTIIGVKDE